MLEAVACAKNERINLGEEGIYSELPLTVGPTPSEYWYRLLMYRIRWPVVYTQYPARHPVSVLTNIRL